MIDGNWSKSKVTAFSGARTLGDPTGVSPPFALQAANAEFDADDVVTRTGFGVAHDPDQAMTAMTNWLSSLGVYLVWFTPGTGVRLIDIASPSPATVHSTAGGAAAAFADAGARLYTAIFGTDGLGATQAVVLNYQSSAFHADKLFPAPLTYTPSAPTEPAAGRVTAGAHYLGYAIEYRHTGPLRLCPDSGVGSPSRTTFQRVTFTAAGAKNAKWTLNTTWPADAVRVHVAMTPVSNPNLYIFVPGAYADVTGGAGESHDITFDISDDELLELQGYNDATEHQLYMAQTAGGTGPFNPSSMFAHGDRMVYITTIDDLAGNSYGAAFVSNRNAFQRLTLENHLIQLPGQLNITTGMSLQGGLYLLNDNQTFVTADNGADPVQWPTPRLIDGRRGTKAPRGVTVAPSKNYGWVADEAGLFCFVGGAYSDLPISYYQESWWKRINWAYAYQVQVVDDAPNHRVCVLVPLDSATTPSHLLTWDYSVGKTAQKAKFSAWYFAGYDPGAIAVVQNDLSGAAVSSAGKKELWLGPSDTDAILRKMQTDETNPYRDNANEIIDFTYETALLPERRGKRTQVLAHHGALWRITGSGSLAMTIQNQDATETATIEGETLSASPGKEIWKPTYLLGEQANYLLELGSLDEWVRISAMSHYWEHFSEQR